MNPKPAFKILAVLALVTNIVASLILFGNLKNPGEALNQSFLVSSLSIVAIIIFSFILFLLYFLSGAESAVNGSQPELITEVNESGNINSNASPDKSINRADLEAEALNIVPKGAVVQNEEYSLKRFAEETLIQFAKYHPIIEGIFFLRDEGTDNFEPIGEYAYYSEKEPCGFKLGETLPGQAAKNKRPLNISEVPENYVKITSGLGKGSPGFLYFLPLIYNNETIAVIEMASFKAFEKESEKLFELAAEELSKALVQLQTGKL